MSVSKAFKLNLNLNLQPKFSRCFVGKFHIVAVKTIA